jgi:Uncharacterized vancomycin resistance protein
MPGMADNRRLMKLLMLALGVLVVALIVVLIIILAQGSSAGEDKQEAFVESNTYLNGVSVAGVDISGLTYEEAAAITQLQETARQVEDGFGYTFTVNGREVTFTAAEIGATSCLSHALKEAMLFGQFGSEAGAQKRQLSENGGKDFALAPYGDIETVTAKIRELKATLDTLPQDATLTVPDDVKLNEEAEYLYELEGVQIVDEVVGVDVDAAALAALICEDINSGTLAGVDAPVILTYPDLSVEDLKANTKRNSLFHSDFAEGSLAAADRVTNINIMSGFVNGTVILPGDTWSINAAAGPRNAETAKEKGWAEAPGITNGRYEDQFGGGVCQVSGTLYNAAIRAELTIVQRYIHSWPSSYVPKGLDATINYTAAGQEDASGTKDLRLANPFDMPVYIVAYVDNDINRLTIGVYGPPLVHGYTVDFATIQVGSDIAPEPIRIYSAAATPDGTSIAAGKSVTWAPEHDGQTWQVWKQYKDANGTVVRSEFFHEDSYRTFQSTIYCNYVDPLYADGTTG